MASTGDMKSSKFRTVALMKANRKPKNISNSERDKMALKKNKLFKRIEADIKERGKRRSPGKHKN